MVGERSLILTVDPTKSCTEQMVLRSGANEDTYINVVTLAIGRFTYELDVEEFVNNYNSAEVYDIHFDAEEY